MHIVIAETDMVARQELESLLAGFGYQVSGVSEEAAAREILDKEGGAGLLIIGSLGPPGGSVQFIQDIRKQREEPYAYIIFWAAQGQEQQIKEALESGADDYLAAPLDHQAVKARVRAGRRVLKLREELMRARESIRFQLHHDALTGLWNRAAIVEILNRELARVRRESTLVGVIMAGLDGLKQINDLYGHSAGDMVLRIAGHRMRASLRPYDEIGRYGGGLFLVVIPGSNTRNSHRQAQRLQQSISEQPIEISQWGKLAPNQDVRVPITISVGVTIATKLDNTDSIIRAAEEATERAKIAGANSIEQVEIPHSVVNPGGES